jgi:3-deoxy-D-manno-octulosonic-acid transferase
LAFFYNILIHLFAFGVWVAALWNKKAKQFLAGRKQWRKNIRATLPAKKNKRYWFHCASLGEFEMARPVIEQIQIEFPQAEIVISFFSPSIRYQKKCTTLV